MAVRCASEAAGSDRVDSDGTGAAGGGDESMAAEASADVAASSIPAAPGSDAATGDGGTIRASRIPVTVSRSSRRQSLRDRLGPNHHGQGLGRRR
jgi:hypothetical protein